MNYRHKSLQNTHHRLTRATGAGSWTPLCLCSHKGRKNNGGGGGGGGVGVGGESSSPLASCLHSTPPNPLTRANLICKFPGWTNISPHTEYSHSLSYTHTLCMRGHTLIKHRDVGFYFIFYCKCFDRLPRLQFTSSLFSVVSSTSAGN